MSLICRNLTKIKYANMLELRAGEEGLNNVILSSHVLEIIEYIDFVKKGDLIITLGYVLQNDKEKWKSFIYKLCEKESAGIIIDKERLKADTLKCIIDACNECDFPLFVMPVEMRLPNLQDNISAVIYEESMKSMLAEKFFLELMYSNMPISISKVKKAEKFGYDMESTYYFIDVECKANSDFVKEVPDDSKMFYTGIKGEMYTIFDEDANGYIKEMIDGVVKENAKSNFTISNGEKYTLLVSSHNTEINDIVKKLRRRLKDVSITYRIGVSCKFTGLDNISKCYEQAVFARHRCNYDEEKYYENFGIDAIIHSSVDYDLLKSIRDSFLGPILELNDEMKRIEILRTLDEYIKHNCNYEETGEVLYCHSNTVRNRINDIEKRLQIDHSSYNDMFNLKLALEINHKIEKEERKKR